VYIGVKFSYAARGNAMTRDCKQTIIRDENSFVYERDKRRPLRDILAETRIIPAVRDPARLGLALAAHGEVVYLLCAAPDTIGDMVGKIKEAGKIPILNIDLMQGFARDKYALRYLAALGVEGVISTHSESLNQAQSLGLYIIQRTFLLDSAAMQHICTQLKKNKLDALEVLPAVAVPKLREKAQSIAPNMPLIGGGLISTMAEIVDLLGQGVHAVSVSEPQLWISYSQDG